MSFITHDHNLARHRERAKTKEERAEDIAYTLNHALACTFTDFIDPYFGNLTQNWIGQRYSIGCGHEHGPDHPHDHHDHDHAPAGSKLRHWVLGELLGDFGAVPVTIAAQRYFPREMDYIQHAMEPILSGVFEDGAKKSATRWVKNNGYYYGTKEYREKLEEKKQEIYEHEVNHLPQAFVWTASSIGINLASQRAMGNKAPLWVLAAGKTVGASISTGGVLLARGLFPTLARNWDQTTSGKVFLPLTKKVGAAIGIDDETVDMMAEHHEELYGDDPAQKNWKDKVSASSNTQDLHR